MRINANRAEREMTVRDWKALWLTVKLQQQVSEHGEVALWNFVDAMHQARHSATPAKEGQ